MSRSNIFFLSLGVLVFLGAGVILVIQQTRPEWLTLGITSLTAQFGKSTAESLVGPRLELPPEQSLQQNVREATERILANPTVTKRNIPTPKDAKLLSFTFTEELAEFNFNRAIVESGGGPFEAASTAILENAYTTIQGRQLMPKYPNLKFSVLVEGQPSAEYFSNYLKETTGSSPNATPLPSMLPLATPSPATASSSTITPSQPGEL